MNIETAFATDGPLAKAIPGFAPRPQQIEMAAHIAATLKKNGVLVAEAGTGTGKTYAYLVPALLNGGKVIISTGKKRSRTSSSTVTCPPSGPPSRCRSRWRS